MVFDGRRGNYREEDTPNPITPYGQSKLEGERALLASGAEVVIVRTSLIYGLNPLDPRTRAVLDGTMPRLFIDERRCPIEVENLCEALIELGESPYAGILNVVGPQAQSRYEFGIKLARALGGDETKLIALRSDESGLVRPKDCTLSLERARQVLETRLRSVDEVLGGQRRL
jgi:dTDP-4-dehydrorhamnose reductase